MAGRCRLVLLAATFLTAVFLLAAGCDTGELYSELRGWFVQEQGKEEVPLPEIPSEKNSYSEVMPENEEEGFYRITFYYLAEDKGFTVPLTREIPADPGIARKTVEELVDTPELREKLEQEGLIPVLPPRTEVLGMHIEDGVARINFNSSFLRYEEEKERIILNCLLCTLKQFESIETVEIMVEGSFLDEFPGGTPGRLPMGPECRVNLEVEEELEDREDYTEVTVYFLYLSPSDNYYYIPVTRVLGKKEDTMETSVQELLKGSGERPGLFSMVPVNTELESLEFEEGVVQIHFSEELLDFRGGRKGEELMLHQVALTLYRHPEVEEVYLSVEGETSNLPYGTDLSEPLPNPLPLNRVSTGL